jgi:hypothetical protein
VEKLSKILAITAFNWLLLTLCAVAQNASLSSEQLNQLSFEDLVVGEDGGAINLETEETNIPSELPPGTPISEIIRLGDISELSPQDLTVEEALGEQEITLEQFPLLGRQTLLDLVNAIPGLGERNVNSVPLIAQILAENNVAFEEGNEIGSLVENRRIGDLQVNSIDLNSSSVEDLPRLEETFLGDLAGFAESRLKDVPGLEELPFSEFPTPLSAIGSQFARIDLIWSQAESERIRTISGSYLEGFHVPCQNNCAHLELDDLENVGVAIQAPFEGSQWISGLWQKVRGGTGCLAGLREPTGIHPFGSIFKVVLWGTDETTDTAEIVLFFRFKTFCGDSPYVLGPFFFPGSVVRINDLVFIGLF